MELALEFTFEVVLGEPLVPGAGPNGTRMVVLLAGGTVSGRADQPGRWPAPARTGRSSASDGWARGRTVAGPDR